MKQRESAVLVVSDVHVGKKTPSYDMRVAQKVLDEVAKRIVRIAELVQDGYRWDEVVICFLGDVLDGSEIFPGQATVQDIPNVLAQATVAARLFLPIVEASLAVAPIVRLVGVAGNHGRAGKNAAEAANWDIVCYQQLEALVKAKWGKRVFCDFNAPTVDEQGILKETSLFWLKLVQIRNHWFLLHHGHRARTVLGVPFYSVRTRALTWRSAFKERWRVLMHGHFHQFGRMDFNDIIVLLNGTAVQHDTWALENFGLQGINRWWLFGVSDKYPITWSFGLDLEVRSNGKVAVHQ